MADKPVMLPTSTSPSQPPAASASTTFTSMPPPSSRHPRSSFSFPSPFARLTNTTTKTMAQTTTTPSPPSSTHPSAPAPAPSATATNTSSKNTDSKDFATKMDITSLMSPPDQVFDSFNTDGYRKASMASNSSNTSYDYQSLAARKHPLPMSPPVSPYSKAISHDDAPSTPPAQAVSDPVLYPADDTATPSPPHAPLFAPNEEIQQNQRIIDSHRARSLSRSLTHLPSDSEYHLILSFRSQVMTHFKANPKGWLRKERALLEADRRATAHRYHAIMPAKPKSVIAAKPPRVARADRITKPATASKSSSAPRTIRASTGPVPGHSPGPGKRSASHASPTPEPSRRAVAPNREDKDFNSIPDYCPPSSSLPSRSNSLKIEWKGQPIDLSNDPHANLLHPDEVALAGNLRLDCATYLTSKRRIFERRLQCLRNGKEFRKTDAQQACKIDVNKASKLWTAFEKVGWLDAKWVRPFA